MKILVTGCAGFIGSHLCRRLLQMGHTVRGIDDLSVGFKENVEDLGSFNEDKKGSHRFLPPNIPWNWMIKDIRDKHLPNIWASSDMYGDIDVIYHLAARGETYWCQQNPQEAVDVNVNGALNILEFAKKSDCKHIVFADTSAEYDGLVGGDWYPTDEDDAPNQNTPMGIYSITKMAASQFVRAWAIENKATATIFRPFNVYGPSMNLDRDIPPVIGSIAVKMLNKEAPIIYGSGMKRRDFIYIDDAVELFRLASFSQHRYSPVDTFNMGTGENYSIYEIYYLVSREVHKYFPMSKKSPIPDPIFEDDKPYEAQITLADLNRTRRAFDWQPKVSIEDGIKRTVHDIAKKMQT